MTWGRAQREGQGLFDQYLGEGNRLPDGHFQGVEWILESKVWVDLINLSEKRIYSSLPRICQYHKLDPWRRTNNGYGRVENAANILCADGIFISPFLFLSLLLHKAGKARLWICKTRTGKWLYHITQLTEIMFWPLALSLNSLWSLSSKCQAGDRLGQFSIIPIKGVRQRHDPKVISIWHSSFILKYTFRNVCNMRYHYGEFYLHTG